MEQEVNRESASPLVTSSFKIERDKLTRFREIAKRNYRSPSGEIRKLIADYVAQAEQEEAA